MPLAAALSRNELAVQTAGDNPDRLRNEKAFAALCGTSPILASSGKTTRYRLNRSGDRQANAALGRIIIVRLGTDQRTKAYLARRVRDGKSKPEAPSATSPAKFDPFNPSAK